MSAKTQTTTPKSNKPKLLKINKPLEKMNRGELDVVAKSLKVKTDKHPNKKSLIDALSPLVKYKAPAKRKSTATAGRKVDWNKAFEWYIADHTRSYADVAKEFGVVKKTVEQAAKYTYTEGERKGEWSTWAERRQELGENARKKAEEDYKKSAPIRSQQHLMQYRNLQVAIALKVNQLANEGEWYVNPTTGKKIKIQSTDARQLADVSKAMKLAIDGERVIMGLPTSVSTIKPGADDETGKGWGELLMLAMKSANEQS
jgi:hypothetical protein